MERLFVESRLLPEINRKISAASDLVFRKYLIDIYTGDTHYRNENELFVKPSSKGDKTDNIH